jgi:hypothetical protein
MLLLQQLLLLQSAVTQLSTLHWETISLALQSTALLQQPPAQQ